MLRDAAAPAAVVAAVALAAAGVIFWLLGSATAAAADVVGRTVRGMHCIPGNASGSTLHTCGA